MHSDREIREEEKEDGRVLFSTFVPFVRFPLKLLRWSSGLSGFHVLCDYLKAGYEILITSYHLRFFPQAPLSLENTHHDCALYTCPSSLFKTTTSVLHVKHNSFCVISVYKPLQGSQCTWSKIQHAASTRRD